MLRRVLLRKSYEIIGTIYKKPTGVGDRWSYAARPEAEDSTFYEFENDWFYVVKDLHELSQLLNKGTWSTSTNPNSREDITDKNGLTKSIPVNNLIMTRITDLFNVFRNTSFNQNIENWDVSGVIFMKGIFQGGKFGTIRDSRFNQDIGGWDVRNVTNMDNMFDDATNFNQNLSGWCVEHIPIRPHYFDSYTPSWTLPKPNWGAPC